MGFQSVVQDGDDLISWDGDLSAGGPSGGIPHGTEGRDNLPGPSRAEFNQVVRERDRALQQCEEMFRALQLASQAMSEHKMVEPSPNHGRDRNSILLDDLDKPDVLGIGTSPRAKPSRESHSVEDLCPGRVRTSCAPEAGSGEARSGSQAHVTINEFGPCGPRASYSQPNISSGVEFRENGKEPTGCGFNEQFPTYHCRDDFVRTSDVDARSRGYYATGSPIDGNVVVQAAQLGLPRQIMWIRHTLPLLILGTVSVENRKNWRSSMGIKLSGLISLHILMWWPAGMIGRTVKKGYSLRLAYGAKPKRF